MKAAQALAGQLSEPALRHGIDRGFRLSHIGHGRRLHGRGKGPGDELGVLLPAQAECAQVDQHMGGCGIGQRAMMVTQQRCHMGTAGLALGCIGQHHDMRDGQRSFDDLGGASVNFVMQLNPLRVLLGQ